MAQDMYDTVLLGVLQKEGQIAKFLDVVMGFLYRRQVPKSLILKIKLKLSD